jgi:hypothetical protein
VSIDDPTLAAGGAAPRAAEPVAPPQIQQPAVEPRAIEQPGAPPHDDSPQNPQTDNVDPATATPAGGEAQLSATRPAASPNVPDSAGQNARFQQRPGEPAAQPPSGAVGSAATLAEIGILTIDQSGTGRLQQVVEGIQVRDVVGQAILIYPPTAPPETIVPPNPNVSDITGRRGAALQPGGGQQPEGGPSATAQRAAPGTSAGSAPAPPVNQRAAAAAVAGQANKPVAGGVIRLVSDRRPAAAAPTTARDVSSQPAAEEGQQQIQPRGGRAQRAASQSDPGERSPR